MKHIKIYPSHWFRWKFSPYITSQQSFSSLMIIWWKFVSFPNKSWSSLFVFVSRMMPKIVVHTFKLLKSSSISSHGYSTLLIHDHNKLLQLPRVPDSFLRGVTASSSSPIARRYVRRLLVVRRRAAPLDFTFDAAVVILVLASAQERSFLSRRQWRKLTVCTWTAASWRSAADGNRTAREALLACSANRESLPTFADSSPNGSPYQTQVSTDHTSTRFRPYWLKKKKLPPKSIAFELFIPTNCI